MNINDLIKIQIMQEDKEYAELIAQKLVEERKGSKTHDGGGVYKDMRGILGQKLFHNYLDTIKWPHQYMEPYQKDMPQNEWDIKVADEIWDVKCRGYFDEKYFNKMTLLMSEHEKNKKCDFYVFTTTDRELDYLYVLGAISYIKLWSSLDEVDQSKVKYPTAGQLDIHKLEPIKKFVFRV